MEDTKMSKKREYNKEYKVQAVKFAKNLGSAKAAAEELQIPVNTLYGWIQKVKSHCAFRPWQPVYQCCISGSHSKIWHCAEHEPCGRKMP